jgi:hypothetical protein
MINNFENFSGDYNPKKDPYVKRYNVYDIDVSTKDFDDTSYAEVVFFNQFEEALLGVVEYANGPPAACYSQSGAINILMEQHGLSEEDAHFAITKIIATDLGPSSPCFLDTSIVEG